MKFISFEVNNQNKVGVLSKNDETIILDLSYYFSNMIDLINNITSDFDYSKVTIKYKMQDVIIKSPIDKPIHDIICVGVNYLDHLAESKNVMKPTTGQMKTVYFSKRATKISGDNELIESHSRLDNDLDYEVELAVIIGKSGRDISRENAEEYIFGYSIFNDFSARSLQKDHNQWYRGKSLDSYTAMGPTIVTKEELPLPVAINIESYVNDEKRQSSNTKHMVKDVASIIEEISQGMTLEAGDIIATGTPAGVGMGFEPPKYLKSNDKVSCIIEHIGVLNNTIR